MTGHTSPQPNPTTEWSAMLPAPWVTHLTCPACHTAGALLAFDGVGTVCTECGDATRALLDNGSEDK